MNLLDALDGEDHLVVDLARPMYDGMPRSPTHPGFQLSLTQRHGDTPRPDGITGSHETIVLGGHVGTHLDAVCHVAVDGRLFDGSPVEESTTHGGYAYGGIEQVAPFVGRAVFFDIPGLTDRSSLEPGEPVTREDLEAAAAAVTLRCGDAALVRTGWGSRWPNEDFARTTHGVPGLTLEAAQWLSSQGVRLVGGDTLAVEQIHAETGHTMLPVHRHLLGECGINILEVMALERLVHHQVRELVFICAPLNILGATGSPVRPLAVIQKGATNE